MAYELTTDIIIAPLPLTERGWGLHLGGTLEKTPRLLYCNQNLIIQRELGNMNKCRINSEHGYKVNVAKYHPNGEWVCSGDDNGDCLVWAHESHVIKNNIKVGKKVNDIAWSEDGQRIFAVGDGKEDKGKVVPWNSNNKLGEITGAQKGFLSCDFKPTRPYRCIASGEDYGVYFYTGPPFKFETYDKTHKNYVNCVRYSSDGNHYISCSSDKKINVYDGKTGKKLREIDDNENGHKGSIYELSWSPDNKKFITASADKTCKVWDFESGKVTRTYSIGGNNALVTDMQVSCLWLSKDYIISISLNGKINFYKDGNDDNKNDDNDNKDNNNNGPCKVITGHRKSIQDMIVDSKKGYVYTCDADSRIIRTNYNDNYKCEDLIGNPHNNTLIKYVRLSKDGNVLYSIAVDDQLIATNVSKELVFSNEAIQLDGAARGFSIGNRYAIVGTHKQKLFVYDIENNHKLAFTLNVNYLPSCATISDDDKVLAVGTTNNQIFLYQINSKNGELNQIANINNQFIRNEVLDLSFSPDNKFLASADRNRHIWIWPINHDYKFEEPINKINSFQFHNAIPSSIQWSFDSKMLVSAGHDNNIYIWLAPTQGKSDNIHLDNAFHGAIRRVSFLDEQHLVGASADCTIRFFNFKKK